MAALGLIRELEILSEAADKLREPGRNREADEEA